MNSIIKKVIKASAGTGKTYRLSLEFINLLLSPIESFEDILVITFTKKASSEIRSAIFSRLNHIIEGTKEGDELIGNLFTVFGKRVNDTDIARLKKVYQEMLINKHKLRISTIDSFVTTVFKGIIAPFMGIVDFEINNDINDRYLPEIYNRFVHSASFAHQYTRIFRTTKFKTIEDYDRFFKSIINNRWLIEMIKEQDSLSPASGLTHNGQVESNNSRINADVAKEYHRAYIAEMKPVLNSFQHYLDQDNKQNESVTKIIKKEYLTDFNIDSTIPHDWLEKFSNCITSEDFLAVHWRLLIDKPQFWNGSTCLRKKAFAEEKDILIEAVNNAAAYLNEYVFHTYLLAEHRDIIELSDVITGFYDQIKLRDHIFTYADITYYTFKHLYDPELSMVDLDSGTVENRFYEYLSTNTRYMLIDEYQDTGIIQHKILLPIIKEVVSGYGAKEYGGVIVVGDEKQSIYGWRSGERELLLKIPHIIGEVEPDTLSVSYRSTPFIMEFINNLFSSIAKSYPETFPFTASLDDNIPPSATDSWDYSVITPHKKAEEGFLAIYFHNCSTSLTADEDNSTQEDPYRKFVSETVKPAYDNGSVNIADTAILARTNNDIRNIAAALEENGIPYYQETTLSVIHHQAVKPIIYLLRYINSRNILYLLQFFRSDFCLMNSRDLKEIIKSYHSTDKLNHGLPDNQWLSIVEQIIQLSNDLDLVALISRIIADFGILETFDKEYHLKNINLFIEVAAEYLSTSPSTSSVSLANATSAAKTIGGFLSYLQENENSDLLRQKSTENVNAIQLLSVHKAKGLQFETVFYYYREAAGSGNLKDLEYFIRYDDNLTTAIEGYLTLNYKTILKNKEIYNIRHSRDRMEALNIIYVALTRAKKNIFLYIPFKNSKGVTGIINDYCKMMEKPLPERSLYKFFIKEIFTYLAAKYNDIDFAAPFTAVTFGKLTPSPSSQHQPLERDDTPYEKYISFNNKQLLKEPEEDTHIDLKSVYVDNKLPLIGEVIHYYLSFICYASPEELAIAQTKTISFFGNIMPSPKIEGLLEKTKLFINENRRLFAAEWTKVFTEMTVFDKRGKEYRLDRLMIDETKKIILIIDYKTGVSKEEGQVERYRRIISALPFVKNNDYQVQTEYIEIVRS